MGHGFTATTTTTTTTCALFLALAVLPYIEVIALVLVCNLSWESVIIRGVLEFEVMAVVLVFNLFWEFGND